MDVPTPQRVVLSMRDSLGNELRGYSLQTLEHVILTCFIAKEAIDWLLSKQIVATREEGETYGSNLQKLGFISNILKSLHIVGFSDSQTFFQFEELNNPPPRPSQVPWSNDRSSTSSPEVHLALVGDSDQVPEKKINKALPLSREHSGGSSSPKTLSMELTSPPGTPRGGDRRGEKTLSRTMNVKIGDSPPTIATKPGGSGSPGESPRGSLSTDPTPPVVQPRGSSLKIVLKGAEDSCPLPTPPGPGPSSPGSSTLNSQSSTPAASGDYSYSLEFEEIKKMYLLSQLENQALRKEFKELTNKIEISNLNSKKLVQETQQYMLVNHTNQKKIEELGKMVIACSSFVENQKQNYNILVRQISSLQQQVDPVRWNQNVLFTEEKVGVVEQSQSVKNPNPSPTVDKS